MFYKNKNKFFVLIAVIAVAAAVILFSYINKGNINEHQDVNAEAVTEILPVAESKIIDKDNLLLSEQVAVLKTYAQLYAETVVKLKPQDISILYYDTASAEYQLNKTALEVITTVRKMAEKDLTLERCEVEYTVTDAYDYKGKTHISLLENNIQKFRFLENPSENFIIQHEFILEQFDGKWYINYHAQEEDFYLLVAEAWENQTGTPQEISEKVMDIIIADTEENILWREENYLNKTAEKTADNTDYDRDAAIKYAENWVGVRNYTGDYLAYDEYGGNCQNFASQCLHAGGLDMDYKGYGQWKFYSKTINEYATADGRSYSWTGVEPFYDYCKYNTAEGLVTHIDWGTAYTQKGDIIQVGAMGSWRHSLFVTDVVYDENGYATEIIVASNTADRKNYPLSAYIYTAPRLIHIVGQN